MKRAFPLVVCIALLPLVACAAFPFSFWKPAATSGTTDVIFAATFEGATYSNADKAGGSATGTTHGSTPSASTTTFKVGLKSFSAASPGDYISFNPTSNFDWTAGGAGVWYYQAGGAFGSFGGIIQVGYSGNLSQNALYISTTNTGFINWQWLSGNSGVAFRTTTGTAMTVAGWYHIQAIHNGTTFTVTVTNSAGTAIQTDSTTGTLGTLAGALDTFNVGDDNSNSGTQFFDNLLVTNSGTRNLYTISTLSSY